MTTYPTRTVVLPAELRGQLNGRLPDEILVSVPAPVPQPLVRLAHAPARAWLAMRAAALVVGLVLEATSAADSYRLYAIQERIFRERYTTTRLPGRPTKVWNGVTWWQRPGTAVAAVPGTSNHGLALAIDLITSPAILAWLLEHAERFGFSWELQSEPWHLHYFAGDNIPAAVLAYENGTTNPPEEDDMAASPRMFIAAWAGRVHLVDLDQRRADWILQVPTLEHLRTLYPDIGAVDEQTMVNVLLAPS